MNILTAMLPELFGSLGAALIASLSGRGLRRLARRTSRPGPLRRDDHEAPGASAPES
jgi:hypothetical protein